MRTKVVILLVLLGLLMAAGAAFAYAPVEDSAKILSDTAVNQVNAKAQEIKSATGKDVWVVIVPTIGSVSKKDAADQAFRERGATGFMLFISFKEKGISIRIGSNTKRAFPEARVAQIRDAVRANFRSAKYDDGVIQAVQLVQDTFRGASQGRAASPVSSYGSTPAATKKSGFPSWIGIVIFLAILLIGFLVIVGIIRAIFGLFTGGGRRGYDGAQGPGYGPGYGGGYGPPAGGGGFWSSLLGGIGGAVVGNAAYDWFRGHNSHAGDSHMNSGVEGSAGDSSWQQPDSGSSFSSDDSGSWGGGDFGGGDSGGGGGDW